MILESTCHASATKGDPVLAQLQARWEARRNAIASVSIKARLFRNGESGVKPLAPKEVAGLARQYVTAVDSINGLRSLIGGLRNESLGSQAYWSDITFVSDRERMSENSLHRFVKDQRADVVADLPGSKGPQAKVYSVHESRYGTLSLDSFAIEFLPLLDATLRTVRRENGVVILTLGSDVIVTQIEVDEESGLVRRYATTDHQRLLREVFQLGTLQCSDAVLLPAVVMETNYANGRLSWASVLAPTEIVINAKLDEGAFKVSMPRDSVVIDLRQGMTRSHVLREAVKDVVEYVQEKSPLDVGIHDGTIRVRVYLALISFLVILSSTIVLILRRLRKTVTHK